MKNVFENDQQLFLDVSKRVLDTLGERGVLVEDESKDRSRQIMTDFIRHQVILRAVMARTFAPRGPLTTYAEDVAQNTREGDVQ